MFRIEVEGETLEELKANLLATVSFLGAKAATAAPTAAPTAAATPKTTPKPPPAEEEPAEEEPAEDESGGIDYETVSGLVVRLSKEKGRDVAINFLKTFKNPATKKPATKGAEIAPADYPRAVEEATALLEEEDVA